MIHNFFNQLESKVRSYRTRYDTRPRRAAVRLALWNLKCAVRRFAPPHRPPEHNSPIREDVLRIAIAEGGGIGDACFQTTYIKEIRKMFSRPVVMDFYCRANKAFEGFPFIDNCLPYPDDLPTDDYDVFIVSRRFYIIVKMDAEKVKRFSPRFYEFCADCKRLTGETLNCEYNDNLYSQYCMLLGKNRLEQANPHGIIAVDRNTPRYMSWRGEPADTLRDFGLTAGEYITINRGAGTPQPGRHPKLWPAENYARLVEMLRHEYPQYKIIQIGTPDGAARIPGTNVNLVGRTNLDQVKVILKYAALHIDGEGGMVHIRRFLNGPSVVFFGPTRADIFGYPENINLSGRVCDGGCEWVTPNWFRGCVRGFDVAPCMRAITPQIAFDAVKNYLDNLPRYEFVESHEKWTPAPDMNVAVIGRAGAADIAKSSARVTVFDTDLSMPDKEFPKNCAYLDVARRGGFSAEYSTPYNIAGASASFDAVYAENMPECKSPELFRRECMRLLRPGGVLVLPDGCFTKCAGDM